MEQLKELQSLCKASITLTINDHKDGYQTVKEYFEDVNYMGGDTEIGQDIMDKMVETDTIVQIQAYPDTPVGFYSVYHYDIDKALDIMLHCVKNNR